jgi:hypothetical protein
MEGARKFKPESKFIEHVDPGHEESLEKKGFDFEYQREFRDFLFQVFREVNIDTFDIQGYIGILLKNNKEDAEKNELNGTYIELSNYIFLSRHPKSRLRLDRKLRRKLEIGFMSSGEYSKLSIEDQHKLITKAYLEKVNLDKLLLFMKIENDQAKKNLLLLIAQIINPEAIAKTSDEVEVEEASTIRSIGTCEKAENHMLSYVSGKHLYPEGGYVNLIVDNAGAPIMLEKLSLDENESDLGNSHSCISLKPIRIGKVLIPAGALFYAQQDGPIPPKEKMNWFGGREKEGAINYVTRLNEYEGFKFLRMSLISLPEKIRASAGGSYYLHQQNESNGYINYDWLTPEIIAEYATERLKLTKKQ